jgi:hypothetical protein
MLLQNVGELLPNYTASPFRIRAGYLLLLTDPTARDWRCQVLLPGCTASLMFLHSFREDDILSFFSCDRLEEDAFFSIHNFCFSLQTGRSRLHTEARTVD